MSVPAVRVIPDAVLAVISGGQCTDNRFFLPAGQLERPMYEAVNKVLAALGGKWNRSAKAHVFPENAGDLIEAAIESGGYAKPSDMGWFPTPGALAERVVDLANVKAGMSVLEPSAGEGAIARAAAARGADVYCVELDSVRVSTLCLFGFWSVHQGDFLAHEPGHLFDRVVMNPPFAKRADVHHVLHARRFLKSDGLLVSIMSGGIAFRQDRLTQEFREQCESIEPLPADSFKESGTNVSTVVITMRGAGGAA